MLFGRSWNLHFSHTQSISVTASKNQVKIHQMYVYLIEIGETVRVGAQTLILTSEPIPGRYLSKFLQIYHVESAKTTPKLALDRENISCWTTVKSFAVQDLCTWYDNVCRPSGWPSNRVSRIEILPSPSDCHKTAWNYNNLFSLPKTMTYALAKRNLIFYFFSSLHVFSEKCEKNVRNSEKRERTYP